MSAVDEVLVNLNLALEGLRAAVADVRGQVSARARICTADELHQAADYLMAAERLEKKLLDLRDEWTSWSTATRRISGSDEVSEVEADTEETHQRLERGLRTPEQDFRLPILRALRDLGGAGQIADVLASVGRELGGSFTEADTEPLASNHRMLRWENTAQWARNTMVKEGLIAPVRERGLWEITDAGREALSA